MNVSNPPIYHDLRIPAFLIFDARSSPYLIATSNPNRRDIVYETLYMTCRRGYAGSGG